MLKKTLFSLALCCLPVMADSITDASADLSFTVATNYSGWHNDSVSGTNSLSYIQANNPGTSIATDTTFSGSNGRYMLNGTLEVDQGLKTPSDASTSDTQGTLKAFVNLPTGSTVFLLSGSEQYSDNETPPAPQIFNMLTVNGGTVSYALDALGGVHSITIQHTPGTPFQLGFTFNPSVVQYSSGSFTDFKFSLVDASSVSSAPEPASFFLIGAALLFALPLLRRSRFSSRS